MYCIVGLGNPGEKYSRTRHNLGFQVVDRLAVDAHTDIRRREYRALTATVRICRSEVLLMKPQTYMNHSGESVRSALRAVRLEPERVVVVYDDIDLPLGRIRIRAGGGSGGHNGLSSVIEETGETAFVRVRLGVGRPPGHADAAEHVLEPFAPHEAPVAEKMVVRATDAVREIVCRGLAPAMNRFNQRSESDEAIPSEESASEEPGGDG